MVTQQELGALGRGEPAPHPKAASGQAHPSCPAPCPPAVALEAVATGAACNSEAWTVMAAGWSPKTTREIRSLSRLPICRWSRTGIYTVVRR